MSRRQANIPVESSWRMVEGGENDSFDTSIVHDPYEDDLILSSGGPSQVSSSSQDYSGASQDSIGRMADRADDDRLITRVPFQPSLASTRYGSADEERTPVPEFRWPKVDVQSPSHSLTHSSRTIRPAMENMQQPMRRRGYQEQVPRMSPQRRASSGRQFRDGHGPREPPERQRPRPPPTERLAAAAPDFLFDTTAWCLSVLGMALRYSKWPLAILLAVYICIGTGMVFKNIITESISTTMSPLCRIPGASFVDLPFCPKVAPDPINRTQVEFDGLMAAQGDFEKVLEDSAAGVSLPMEMKQTEASVRDLRTMVKFSDLPNRHELVSEFDQYIETIRQVADDLQIFNTHVGSAVDSVVSINRWTSRFIDSVAAQREANDNLMSRWVTGWLFAPFQPAVFDERALLDKYVEHTALVSDKISGLILEAQAALRQLRQAEAHLQLINEHVVASGNAARAEKSEIFWTLWTLVGANTRRLHNLGNQIGLLSRIDAQRGAAVAQLVGLLHDLGDIQTKLSDLRDRVAAPELLRVDGLGGDGNGGPDRIPLSVHIETINAGVERLEAARSRIRAEENERLQQALSRARGESGSMIDG